MSSTVLIERNGNSLVGVRVANASFEAQANAQPGIFELTVRDPLRILSFTTGDEITCTVDGVLLFGGYLTQVARGWALPVDDTSDLSEVESRQWVLRGVDFNILFDKRVLRNTANYLARIPATPDGTTIGEVVTLVGEDYIDLPAGFDVSTDVTDTTIIDGYPFLEQSSTWRKQNEALAMLDGAIWYMQPSKRLRWTFIENSESRWGFSDVPNHRIVTASPASFQGAVVGFRELDLTEDGSLLANDAFVWGGNQFSGESGGTVFGRYEADGSDGLFDSIGAYGRWQFAETHFGDSNYASESLVDIRARVIVNGSPTALQPGAVDQDSHRGLRFTQYQAKLTWFADRVPTISGVPDHLRPGDLVTMVFHSLGDGGQPLILQLPLRRINMSFPLSDETGDAVVKFEGSFGLQASDPWTLWRYLLTARTRIVQTALATSDSTTTAPVFGSFGQFEPEPATDGTTTTFSLPNGIGYIAGTSQVYLNGILQSQGLGDTDAYVESDPPAGEFTFNVPPEVDDSLWVICLTTGT